jgi:hypothetical protein
VKVPLGPKGACTWSYTARPPTVRTERTVPGVGKFQRMSSPVPPMFDDVVVQVIEVGTPDTVKT